MLSKINAYKETKQRIALLEKELAELQAQGKEQYATLVRISIARFDAEYKNMLNGAKKDWFIGRENAIVPLEVE